MAAAALTCVAVAEAAGKNFCHCRQSFHKLLVKLFKFASERAFKE